MIIKEIYQKFSIPGNLQEHMLTVAEVIQFIKNHWHGPDINWDNLILAALLHDLGNIVRFDFEKHPEFLGEEIKRLPELKKLQKQIIEQYGTDDHTATQKMLKEIGVNEDLLKTIFSKSFSNSTLIAEGTDWYTKLLHYADMRVSPKGIVPLEERILDVRQRGEKYKNRPDFEDLIQSCRDIERQIQNNLKVDVKKINNIKNANTDPLLAQNI